MQTAMMTGCGSVLWMAPEILVADKYVLPSFNPARPEIEKSVKNVPERVPAVAQQTVFADTTSKLTSSASRCAWLSWWTVGSRGKESALPQRFPLHCA